MKIYYLVETLVLSFEKSVKRTKKLKIKKDFNIEIIFGTQYKINNSNNMNLN